MIRLYKFGLVVLVFSVCLGAAFAEIMIDGENVYVETDAYSVQFHRGVMGYIHNKRTGETYTIPESDSIHGNTAIFRRDHSPIAARNSVIEAIKTGQDSARLVFSQPWKNNINKLILNIEVEPMTGDLLVGGHGEADTGGVYGFLWDCDNIDINSVDLILPAHGGQVITASSPFESKRYDYPALWEAQLAIVQGDAGGFFVRGTDKTFRSKYFKYEKNSKEITLGFQTYNQAPWDALNTVQSVVWRFNTYVGDYRVPAQIYRYWMEEAFEPWRLSDVPSWVEDIGLVIMLRDYRQPIEVLSQLAEQIDPSKTLLYVVLWRKDRYDHNYPDYTPRRGLGDVLKAARNMGYRVMLHVNLVGVSPYHPLYPEFQAFQFRSVWDGDLIGWRWDELDDPRRHAWINNASSKFRDLLVSRFQEVWEEYQVDAFHLDISHAVLNDANGLIEGLNSAQGNVLMHKQLAEAMPGVVFSGEHLHEVTFFRESFAQRWMLPQESTAHPISAFLFSPYTRLYGHLGMPSLRAKPQEYQMFLDAYDSWGVLPTLRDADLQQESYDPLTQQVLSVARQWQELGLRPDFESDWGVDGLFQYVTADGETVIYQQTPEGYTLLLERSADLNQDGVINVLDLVFVTNNFGTADGDMNGDGQTNILDLVLVTQQFTR